MERIEEKTNNDSKKTKKITQDTSKKLWAAIEYKENNVEFVWQGMDRKGRRVIEYIKWGGMFILWKPKN